MTDQVKKEKAKMELTIKNAIHEFHDKCPESAVIDIEVDCSYHGYDDGARSDGNND